MAKHAPTTPATLARRRHTRVAPGALDRRRLLGGLLSGAASIALIAPADAARTADPPPVDPDAELIAACVTFHRVERDLYAVPDTASDEVHTAKLDLYHDAYDAVSAMSPATLTGAKAKALVVISGLAMQEPNFAGDTVEECAEWHVLGAWNLLHELTAMGAVA